VYFEYICWKFAGRLLDRVNIPLLVTTRQKPSQSQIFDRSRGTFDR